jgi:hypothetical protein
MRTDITFTTALPFASTRPLKSGKPRTDPLLGGFVGVLAAAACTAFPVLVACEHAASVLATSSAGSVPTE